MTSAPAVPPLMAGTLILVIAKRSTPDDWHADPSDRKAVDQVVPLLVQLLRRRSGSEYSAGLGEGLNEPVRFSEVARNQKPTCAALCTRS